MKNLDADLSAPSIPSLVEGLIFAGGLDRCPETKTISFVEAAQIEVTASDGGLACRSTEDDPWMIFEFDTLGDGAATFWLRMKFETSLAKPPSAYFDFGHSFSEVNRVFLSETNGFWSASVQNCLGLCRVRFDPVEDGRCAFEIYQAGVTFQPTRSELALNDGFVYIGDCDLTPDTSLHAIALQLRSFNNLKLKQTGEPFDFRCVGADPHLRFSLTRDVSGAGLFWIEVASPSPMGDLSSIYLDFGDGFSEENRYILQNSGSFWFARVSETKGLVSVRLDHTESVITDIHLKRVGLTLLSALPEARLGTYSDKRKAVRQDVDAYQHWYRSHEPTSGQLELQRRLVRQMKIKPKISIIVPIYIVEKDVVSDMINSVISQTYDNWELCLALAYHDNPDLSSCVREFASSNSRIFLIETPNEGISKNSNKALKICSGDYVALLDHDDTISENALFEMVKEIIKNPCLDLVYSDKDMISGSGEVRHSPLFKPAWSPEMMLNANYLTHFNFIRRDRILEIDGWDPVTDGAQDWDLFLRVIARNNAVAHVPKVLYHWRQVPTSVAGGGMSVKPYAVQAQLLAVHRYLLAMGYSSATPVFAAPDLIKIDWSADFSPRISLIILGGEIDEKCPEWVEQLEINKVKRINGGGKLTTELNEHIEADDSDIIVIIPFGLSPITEGWLKEIVGPLENASICASTGKLLGSFSNVLDAGWIAFAGSLIPIFKGFDRHAYSLIGSVNWYRNVVAASFATLAFRRKDWIRVGGFPDEDRPDLAFCLKIAKDGKRILYNPFAESWLAQPGNVEALLSLPRTYAAPAELSSTMFNPNLVTSSGGEIGFVTKARSTSNAHDYSAESRYVAHAFDFDAQLIRQSKSDELLLQNRNASKNQRRVLWLVPDFGMPFYGGVMTILRAADHMRRSHSIANVIVGVGVTSATKLRKTISLAFKELADESEIYVCNSVQDADTLDFGVVDAGVCTLWTTAYSLLKLANVKEKFYFMQDYEPLFYPAGSTSSLVEATYRFGFTAIANTEPLAKLYREHGGSAHHFVPAVDPGVFHAHGRSTATSKPLLLFSYARPGHPRNCFEVLSAGMKLAKDQLTSDLEIVTAGSDWNTAEYGLEGVVEHLGVLRYEETGELYRACDVGLVAMATRHPSYLPLELMACGALVLTNRNSYTSWLLRDHENSLLFDLSKTSVMNTIVEAFHDQRLRQSLAARGQMEVSRDFSDWSRTCERIYSVMFRD